MGVIDTAVSNAQAEADAIHQQIIALEGQRNEADDTTAFTDLDEQVHQLVGQYATLSQFLARIEQVSDEDRQLVEKYQGPQTVVEPVLQTVTGNGTWIAPPPVEQPEQAPVVEVPEVQP